MIFTQPVFFLFLAVAFTLYWLLRGRREAQLAVLLVASAIFYGWWDWRFLGLIGVVIALSWLSALQASKRTPGRRAWLVAGIAGNLAILGIFKYAGFFSTSFAELVSALGLKANVPVLNILLPVGVIASGFVAYAAFGLATALGKNLER